MPNIEVEFEISCETCGKTLTATVGEGYQKSIVVEVEPCETCMENAREEIREEEREE